MPNNFKKDVNAPPISRECVVDRGSFFFLF